VLDPEPMAVAQRSATAAAFLVVLAAAGSAAAEPARDMLGETSIGLGWDGDRLAGGEVIACIDWRGLGVLARADYQRQQQHLVEQEVEFVLGQPSAALGFGLHLSPMRFVDYRVGRVVDAFVEAGFAGGVTDRAGGPVLRGDGYVTLGGAVRFPWPHSKWLPAVSLRYSWRRATPDFVYGRSLVISIGVAQESVGDLRD